MRLTGDVGVYWRRAGSNYGAVYFLSAFSSESVSFQTSRKVLQLAHRRRMLQVRLPLSCTAGRKAVLPHKNHTLPRCTAGAKRE